MSVICGQNTKAITLLFGNIGSFSSLFNVQSNSINFNFGHLWAKYQGYSLTFCPELAHFHHYSMCNQNQSISISVIFRQNTKAIALLFGKIGSFSSLFNVQSNSINFNFGHLWAKYQGYSLTFCPKLAHFHHFSMCNQNQSISLSVICGQNTKAIALLCGQNWLIFITFQCAIKINQFPFRSFVGKIPRLQPYFLSKIGSFSSLFNVQSKSINFNFGHLWAKYQGYSLTVWQNWLIFIRFQCAIKLNQFQFRSFVGKLPRLQPYFLAKIGSFSSPFNVQLKSINFNFGHLWAKYQGYSLTCCPKLAHFHHLSMWNQNQSISISVICGQNTKAIALLFGQNWLIFITFQCAIKINQFQFRSFVGKIPRLQPYFLAKIGSFSSPFNVQLKSINFNFGHLWAKYQGYSLTCCPKLAHFHHLSMCNQNQSISISVICGQNTKAIALLFGQNWLIFITFQCAIKINQFPFRSFVGKIPRLQPYFLAKIGSFSSLFNVQSKSINLNVGHLWAKYQGYNLTVWQHWLIFIPFQCAIKLNQFQFRSFVGKIPRLQPYFLSRIGSFSSLFNVQSKSINFNFGHFSAKYQGYSLTVWQNWLIFITFQCAIKLNQFQFRSFVGKIPRLQPYFLSKIGSFSSLFNVQSKSINFTFGHLWAKYQGYSLTLWPKLAHFHHFSMCNQNQSISISVICGQNTKAIALLFVQNWLIFITFQCAIKINQFQFRSFVGKIPRLQPYCLAKLAHFHPFSMCNQTQSISISVICGQITKAIALLFGQNWLIFIAFQCAIKINQFQFRSFVGKIPRLQPYLLSKISSFSSPFNVESKSINFNFGHLWAKYQGYSLTVWPKLAHFHHFSMCNQNQSISISVICGQNTKAIALLFVQNWLIFITIQCAIKINQFQFRSFVGKIPRLQPYFLAKIGSFSSLFNVQSKSINFNFGHLWAKYQGYSLTFWPKLAHFHHFSMCNQNQSS